MKHSTGFISFQSERERERERELKPPFKGLKSNEARLRSDFASELFALVAVEEKDLFRPRLVHCRFGFPKYSNKTEHRATEKKGLYGERQRERDSGFWEMFGNLN